MAKETFKVCARYTGPVEFKDKHFDRFTVVGTGTLVHIPIEHTDVEMVLGGFYLIDVYPRHYENENYLSFKVRCRLTLPKSAESMA